MRSVEGGRALVSEEGRLGERACRASRPKERERKAMGKWTVAGWIGLLGGWLVEVL